MDWPALIEGLRIAGLNQTDIARYCGVTRAAVSLLVRRPSTEPGFSFGARMVELYLQRVGDPTPHAKF